ncbi:hypothetical protein [Streptomyces spectabilis]|uniref:Uncharacterized protein n=1 Tax=Streptomyces spectabilis TaxID=68270 RepID=A0A7W8ATM9_STRST|nr:hypothetical protein [Streptomyces spectabilis]MBB5104328.1 hypothetical protein [Streptomyces spectabilis]MCI3905313.1 hypothetical protein [Streptomyces spectabilis]
MRPRPLAGAELGCLGGPFGPLVTVGEGARGRPGGAAAPQRTEPAPQARPQP